ncbi:M48 family metalloprotease [Pseudoalteromonas fenneropenaei]|uniref:Putative beta-barrel assembly-enhancing protease n=1 Tax=Pseudoalteromonas fenneropenaei TaxID=1737459 RepID=A0ABV7CIG8_9GAMM
MKLKLMFVTLLSLSALPWSNSLSAQSSFNLPDLGTSALQALPLEKEQAIGEVMMMQIRSRSPLVQDPVLDEYLSTLGNRLVANADDVRFPFRFFWIKNPEINAFAFYGGHVGVHSGLLAESDNESQFASVIGHEIAHVTQRHLARRIQQQKDNSAMTIAGLITGILATVVAPDAGIAILSASSTQTALDQLSHSRKAEQEADRIGMKTMKDAGFDPYEASEFLTKLQEQVRYKNTPPAFLLTHPMPDSRISDIRLRAQQYDKKYVPSSLNFALAKARVMARYQYGSANAEQFFKTAISRSSALDNRALEYGLALTLLDQKKLPEAAELLKKLRSEDPNNLFYLDAQTDLLIAQGNSKEAVTLLAQFHDLRPNNQVITLNYANAALEAKNYTQAAQLLRVFLLEKPDHVLAKELLTKAYEGLENKAAYHEANADLMADYGAYMKAADEIQKALNHVENGDEIKQQRLKALLSQYRQMQKELAKL